MSVKDIEGGVLAFHHSEHGTFSLLSASRGHCTLDGGDGPIEKELLETEIGLWLLYNWNKHLCLAAQVEAYVTSQGWQVLEFELPPEEPGVIY